MPARLLDSRSLTDDQFMCRIGKNVTAVIISNLHWSLSLYWQKALCN